VTAVEQQDAASFNLWPAAPDHTESGEHGDSFATDIQVDPATGLVRVQIIGDLDVLTGPLLSDGDGSRRTGRALNKAFVLASGGSSGQSSVVLCRVSATPRESNWPLCAGTPGPGDGAWHHRDVGTPAADQPTRRMSARFVADAVSVPTLRRVCTDRLRSWSMMPVVDDAALIITELCANAALHSGGRFFDLVLEQHGTDMIRIAVTDDGAVPAAAVAARPAALQEHRGGAALANAATTGRGLTIVAILSNRWRVEDGAVGKRVWAELSPSAAAQPAHDTVPVRAGGNDEPVPDELPPGWHVVQLLDCPVALSLRQDDHLDELIRELQLITISASEHHPPDELGLLIADLLGRHAHARHMGRRVAQDAAASGASHITIDMLLPAEAVTDVQRLNEAVTAADELCERRQLLALASPPDVRRLRSWMTSEFSRQILEGQQPTAYRE